MSPDDNADDADAKKARADAIRRARDRRNEQLDAPIVPPVPGTAAADQNTVESPSSDDGDSNYVEFIDRKMRERKKSES